MTQVTTRLVASVGYIVVAAVLAVPVVVVTVRQPALLWSVLVPYVALAAVGAGLIVYLGHRADTFDVGRVRVPDTVRQVAPSVAIGAASGIASNFFGTHVFAMVAIGLTGAMISFMVFAIVRILTSSTGRTG